MSRPRTLFTTMAMILVAGLVVAMMAVLWMVGQDLLRLKEARSDQAPTVQQTEKSVAALRAEVTELRGRIEDAKLERQQIAGDLKAARTQLTTLAGELGEARRRLKALEDVPKAEPPAPAPEPPKAEAPMPLPMAVRRGFNRQGFAGLAQALGLDQAGHTKLLDAYNVLVPKVRAAEKAHAKLSMDGDAVRIHIVPFPEEGQALRKEWEAALAQFLTPAQAETYRRSQAEGVLFDRAFGDCEQTILLSRDPMGVKVEVKGRRLGPGGAPFESAATVSGAGAVDRLPWRHLLPEESVAKLRGVAAEP